MTYKTKERIKNILLAIILATEVAIGIYFYLEDKRAAEAVWIGSYPMANQHIEWTYAGKGEL